jgi:hypothetical protein
MSIASTIDASGSARGRHECPRIEQSRGSDGAVGDRSSQGAAAIPLATAIARERAIAARLADHHATLATALIQRGLFDRRAERQTAEQRATLAAAMDRARNGSTISFDDSRSPSENDISSSQCSSTDMIAGVHGRLITASFARNVLPSLPEAADVPDNVFRALRALSERIDATLGPAAAVRSIA